MKILSVLFVFLIASTSFAEDLACFYKNTNYQGAKFCYYPGQRPPDLVGVPLNDGSIADGYFGSIQIVGNAGAYIYSYPDYNGSSSFITTSVPDLSTIGWSEVQIQSVDVEYQ